MGGWLNALPLPGCLTRARGTDQGRALDYITRQAAKPSLLT